MRYLAAVLLVLLVGCGPSPETTGGGPQARSTALVSPTASDDGPATDEPPPDSPPGATTVAVTLVQPGPASPDTPAPFRWYASLATLSCDGLADAASANVSEQARSLFLPLADVCRVLAGQDATVDWEQARAALGTDVGSDCLLAAARDMLASAVAAHDSAPDALLVPGPAAAGTACAPSIERAELVEPTRLTLSGPYLFGPATVAVGEVTAPAPEPSVEVVDGVPLATLDVTLPQPVCLDPSRPVSVRLQAQDYEASAVLSGSSAGCAPATADADGTTDPEAGS